jgi:adenosylcobinamide-GDP ribazoletransferase
MAAVPETHRDTWSSRQADAFVTAVQFLTRIPIPTRIGSDEPERLQAALVRSAIYFPFVGGLITSATAMAVAALLHLVSVELAVVLAIAMEAMLTGAFHEDALADTCDALGGGWTRERVLEILKDSRLGTYGTLGLGLGVACRVFAIVTLAEQLWLWYGVASLVASGVLGRWGMLWLMHTVPPITDRKTMVNDVSDSKTGHAVLYSACIGLPLVGPWLWLDPWGVLIATASSAVVLAAYRWKIMQRVGGSTGDLIGCSAYLVQLVVLVIAAARSTGNT